MKKCKQCGAHIILGKKLSGEPIELDPKPYSVYVVCVGTYYKERYCCTMGYIPHKLTCACVKKYAKPCNNVENDPDDERAVCSWNPSVLGEC